MKDRSILSFFAKPAAPSKRPVAADSTGLNCPVSAKKHKPASSDSRIDRTVSDEDEDEVPMLRPSKRHIIKDDSDEEMENVNTLQTPLKTIISSFKLDGNSPSVSSTPGSSWETPVSRSSFSSTPMISSSSRAKIKQQQNAERYAWLENPKVHNTRLYL